MNRAFSYFCTKTSWAIIVIISNTEKMDTNNGYYSQLSNRATTVPLSKLTALFVSKLSSSSEWWLHNVERHTFRQKVVGFKLKTFS